MSRAHEFERGREEGGRGEASQWHNWTEVSPRPLDKQCTDRVSRAERDERERENGDISEAHIVKYENGIVHCLVFDETFCKSLYMSTLDSNLSIRSSKLGLLVGRCCQWSSVGTQG